MMAFIIIDLLSHFRVVNWKPTPTELIWRGSGQEAARYGAKLRDRPQTPRV